MPIIVCENGAGISSDMKAKLASEITDAVHLTIQSPMDLITVYFHDLPASSRYRAGSAAADTVIFCHIRAGRSDEAIESLLARVSESWSRITGDPEDSIELAAAQYPAKHAMRGGARLPEPPIV